VLLEKIDNRKECIFKYIKKHYWFENYKYCV
jgi:hypothetical protein